jgi:hypothetical protein
MFYDFLTWIIGPHHWGSLFVLLFSGVAAAIAAATIAGRLSRAIKISEFRQKWIDDLRADIANFVGASHRWIRAYDDYNNTVPPDEKPKFENKKLRPIQNEAYVILYRIRLRINPRPLDENPTKIEDDRFLQSLLGLLDPGKIDPTSSFEASWIKLADSAVDQGREILKREWDVAKRPSKWF